MQKRKILINVHIIIESCLHVEFIAGFAASVEKKTMNNVD